jgi:hypothetical protein
MWQGSVVYAGPRARVVEHFTSPPLGFEFDPNSNPAEFILDVCAGGNISASSSSSISTDKTTSSAAIAKKKKSHVLSSAQLKDLYDRSEYCRGMRDNVAQAVACYEETEQEQRAAAAQGGSSFLSVVGTSKAHKKESTILIYFK